MHHYPCSLNGNVLPCNGCVFFGVFFLATSSSLQPTKTRSDPQRVRMSSGERPIGAAKGKQPNTRALTPPPHGGNCHFDKKAQET